MQTSVFTKAELKTAVETTKYDTIDIYGECAGEIADSVRKANNGNMLSNVSLLAGLIWWPALIGGIGGKIATRNLKKYEIDDVSEGHVRLKLKSKYL